MVSTCIVMISMDCSKATESFSGRCLYVPLVDPLRPLDKSEKLGQTVHLLLVFAYHDFCCFSSPEPSLKGEVII